MKKLAILFCTAICFYVEAYSQNEINYDTIDKILKQSDFVIYGTFIRHLPDSTTSKKINNRQFYEIHIDNCMYNQRIGFTPLIFPQLYNVILVEHTFHKFNVSEMDSIKGQNANGFTFFIKQKENPDSLTDFEITNSVFNSVYQNFSIWSSYLTSNYFINYANGTISMPTILPDTFKIKKPEALSIARKKLFYYKDTNGWIVMTKPEFQNKEWIIYCSKRKGKQKYIRSVYIDARTGKVVKKERRHYEVRRHWGPKF